MSIRLHKKRHAKKKLPGELWPGLLLAMILPFGCQNQQLEWQQQDGYRWAEVRFSRSGEVGFTRMSPEETGVTKVNRLTKEQISANRHLLNGSGVTIGDVDGDGLADIYLCQLDGPNALYKNLGDWRFRDVTEQAGVACEDQFSTGAVLSDLDGDGDLDLLVTAIGGPNACFLNDGTGTFQDVSEEAGIQSQTGAMSMALADTDGDGDLDLYIVNNKKQTVKDLFPAARRSFERTVKKVGERYEVLPEFKEHYVLELHEGTVLNRYEVAEPDFYLRNDGSGKFTRVAPESGVFADEAGKPLPELKEWGLSARFQDIDADGDPDLYICNDFESPDRLWINDGSGSFQAIDKLALRSMSASSMGIDFSDINRDGLVDFFLTEMLSRRHDRRKMQQGPVAPAPAAIGRFDDRPQYMRNSLFLNRGDNTFAEIGQYAGIDASEWSWSPVFLDVDLDGYEDLLVVTGHYYDGMDMDAKSKLSATLARQTMRKESEVFQYPRLELQNFAFRNRGDLTFTEISQKWQFDAQDISHGMATGDLDNDGDLDIVYNSLENAAGVYRNDAAADRVAVRLRGAAPNTQAIGAKIWVLGGPTEQSTEVVCGDAYLSSSDQLYSFAAGDANRQLTIEVTWRNGTVTRIDDVRANRIYEIDEQASLKMPPAEPDSEPAKPVFADASASLQHTHIETVFDDFQRQPLLPKKLSQSGPALLWADLDGNALDDLVVTTGRGGQTTALLNNGQSRFQRKPLMSRVNLDQTAIVGWRADETRYHLVIVQSNYEDETALSQLIRMTLLHGRVVEQSVLAELPDAIEVLALADYTGDGQLDLFAGGRSLPGRYPEPASSYFFTDVGNKCLPDERNNALLTQLGLVNGATFSDFDGDGDPDLVIAREWGPVTVLQNDAGQFWDATAVLGLADWTGWWQGIATGDFNNDGQMDVIATNWGRNSKFRATRTHPLKMYSGDFDNNGTVDIIQAYYDSLSQSYVPETSLALLGPAMPYLLTRIRSFSQFSVSTVDVLLGPQKQRAAELVASELAHLVFLRKGEKFEAKYMPAEAQFAPALFCGVADFDNDGHDDIFLSQNFFATNAETARLDGGRGLWLRGDGEGGFETVSGRESGILVYGEQRGAALSDFDGDGRVDIAVSQNGAATRLYRNQSSATGVRVQLIGPAGNRDAIGTKVRLRHNDQLGPLREIQAGSGYAGQNSAVQVFGAAGTATGVWVQWPDGIISEIELADGQKVITVLYPENVELLPQQ